MQIDLVYFQGCPHVVSARQHLVEALASLGIADKWTEWDTTDATTPERFRGYASPTVLVNGIDVERKDRMSGAGCAVGGGPTVEALRAAIALAISSESPTRR